MKDFITKVGDTSEDGCISRPLGKAKGSIDEIYPSAPIVEQATGVKVVTNQVLRDDCTSTRT